MPSDAAQIHIRFRFAPQLHRFLKPAFRVPGFDYFGGATDTVKHLIESFGVPHTEIGEVLSDGCAVTLSDQLHDGAVLDVHPMPERIYLEDPRFVADGHVGRLAAYLRMLGFDCWYERTADDETLAHIASSQQRLLLTRDVGLLKRREVERGYCVRADKPHDQLREVVTRFSLEDRITPFQRCMDCNGQLVPVQKADVEELLPPHTRATKEVFSRCLNCGKIYWRGSHHARMLGWIADLTEPSYRA